MAGLQFFKIPDYLIFSITIVVSLGIGIYYALSGGKQRTTAEYFVGNRKMSFLPVAVSLMVSFESSIMMLGTPAEVYVYGIQWLVGNFGFFIANILSIYVFIPLIHPLRITSAYEYLEKRFKSRAVRILGTVLGMISYTAYMGIVLFGPAIALEGVTGFPQWGSIVLVAAASVIYTAIGGLKAVIWTDVFQAIVMFAGFFAVLIKGTMQIGGVKKTWQIANEDGRVNLFNFDPDPTIRHTFWNLFIGSVIRGGGLIFNQSSVQRISSIPTIQEARKVMLYVAPGFFLSLTFAGIEGVIAYAFYATKGCDPLASKQITNPNQIVPFMVMDIFEGIPGMPGLFMASLFSASLSTLSSGLSSLSALFWTDLVQPHVKPMSEFRATIISKISVVVFGGLAVFIAFMIALVGGTLIQIAGSLLSAFGGPLSGLFLFGAFCPFATSKGAFWGTIMSAICTFVICIGQMMTPGSVKNTKLPSAPTDFCPAANSSLGFDWSGNSTMMSGYLPVDAMNATMMLVTSTLETTTAASGVPEPTGFRRLFMLSYQWFGGLGILQVFVYGTIISYFTGWEKAENIDKRTVMSFYDTLMPFLPECIKKPLRCGYDDVFDRSKAYENGDAESPKETDVFYNDIDVIIEQPEMINTKLMESNDIKREHLKLQTTPEEPDKNLDEPDHADENKHTTTTKIPLSDVLVTSSVDDLRVRHVPIKDMEFEIIKSGSSRDDIAGQAGSAYIVLDHTDDGLLVKFKAKSVEFDVVPEIPDVTVTPATPGEEEKVTSSASGKEGDGNGALGVTEEGYHNVHDNVQIIGDSKQDQDGDVRKDDTRM